MKYDFEYMRELIENEIKENTVVRVSAGMKEDWFWTADDIYDLDGYNKEIFTKKLIGGIDRSYWATPIIVFFYKDGSTKELLAFRSENHDKSRNI